jgi:hypothetical protein
MLPSLEKFLAFVIIAAIGVGVLITPMPTHWGFSPWHGAPRLDFDSEPACWEWLARAKATNDSLLQAVCTPAGPPRPLWWHVRRSLPFSPWR